MNSQFTLEYSVVIPVYNGKATLEELIQRLQKVFLALNCSYEVIFVDDGSTDTTWDELLRLKKKLPEIKAFRLMKNFGQHNAIMCALNYVQGNMIITLDADLQHPPEEIVKLINKIREGYDVVYGLYYEKKHSKLKNLSSKFVQWIYKMTLGTKGDFTAFRILNIHVVKAITKYDKGFAFIDGLIAWHTNKIGYAMVKHEERKTGKSCYTFGKMILLGLNLLTNFSIYPLQIASLLGLACSVVGFVMALYYFIFAIFFGMAISGFATIIVALTLFSGIQLLVLGLIGEYLGRVHLNINSKPQFYIRESAID